MADRREVESLPMLAEAGGDAACWLERVCPECNAFLEAPDEPCWRCGARPEQVLPPALAREPRPAE